MIVILRCFLAASFVYDIAVDPTIKRVVYTDSGLNHIAALNYDGSNHEVVLQTSDLGAIVLQPETRYVYVHDVGTRHTVDRQREMFCQASEVLLSCPASEASLLAFDFLVKFAIL